MQLLVNPLDVRMHRAVADVQQFGGFLVAVALGKGIEDTLLPRGKAFRFAPRRSRLFERPDDFARDVARHRRPATEDVFDRRHQLGGAYGFQQIARGPAASDLKMVSGSSCTVSIRIRAAGTSWLNWRTHSTPLLSGRLMSIRITSGRNAGRFCSASLPDPYSPTQRHSAAP